MNRTDLVKKIASRMDISQAEALRFINVMEEEVSNAVKTDGSLVLVGFGTFSAWKQTERVGRNPKNGVECMIKPRTSVKFKPGKFLLEDLNSHK
jgi:DNA-binding protein HU-beta